MAASSETDSRLARTGRIRRCRGHRLYTGDGRRILDLWQGGGRAILGHRPAGTTARIKDDLERGLWSPLAGGRDAALAASITRLVPGCEDATVRLYRNFERALNAVASVVAIDTVRDLPREPFSQDRDLSVVIWRPFLPSALWDRVLAASPDVILPVVPIPMAFQMQPVIYRDVSPPSGDLIAPVELSAAASAVDRLRNTSAPESRELDGFTSYGPYLMPVIRDDYDSVFHSFLDRDILLSPDPDTPSIVPAVISDGETALLVRAAREINTEAAGNGD